MIVDDHGLPQGSLTFPVYLGSKPDQVARETQLRPGKGWTLRANPKVIASSREAVSRPRKSSPVETPDTHTLDSCINHRWEHEYTNVGSTRVGELHSTTDVATHDFDYGIVTDSSIDVGLKSQGEGWSIGGFIQVATRLSSVDGIRADATDPDFYWGGEQALLLLLLLAVCRAPRP